MVAALAASAVVGSTVTPSLTTPAAAAAGANGTKAAGAAQDSDSPESLAVKEARRTGKPVDVAVMRSESSDTVAQPDGKLVTTTYVQPKRVRKGGTWIDIDPALHTLPNGAVAPKAATADVEFSGGGSAQPLVRISNAGKELKLSWPKPLPKPVVDGSTAEYRGILPDVDLKLTATRTGFSQVLVVHSAVAAKNPELDQLRLGLKSDDLSVQQAADGSLKAVDRGAGGTVFEAPVPVMWDSSTPATDQAAAAAEAAISAGAAKGAKSPKPGTSGAAAAQGRSATESSAPAESAANGPLAGLVPGDGAKVAKLKVELPKDTMVLTPDRSMLDDPATVFPVMIDPAWNTPHANDWAGVSRYYASQTYWHFTYNANVVHDWGVGYCGDTSKCAPTDVKRAFFQLPNNFIGKQIITAQFSTWESHAYTCGGRDVELWNTGYISPNLTWNSQNAAGFWSRKLQTISSDKGGSGCTPAGWLEFGDSGVRNLVQDAANWGWPTISFGLKARDETDLNAWKRFTDDAYMQVYYNVPPRQMPMSDMTMSPGGQCQYPAVGINKMPSITTRATDPDGEAVGVQFSVGWDAGDGAGVQRRWWSTGADGNVPASNTFKGDGSYFSMTLPDSFPHGIPLAWDARAWDGASWGPWSSDGSPTACYFTVDTSAPDGPAVTSAAYPISKTQSDTIPWVDGVGRYGTFTVDSAATDVTEYQWSLDDAPYKPVTTSGGAPQNIQVLPETEGLHTLSVKSLDGARNASQPEVYYFKVLKGQPQRAGWSADETGGTTLAGTGGTFPATLGSTTTVTPTGHLGQAISLDGSANAYAETAGAVVDTTASFTVSAWVNLTSSQYNVSAVSQAGSVMSAFDLGMRNGKWGFSLLTKDANPGYSYQEAISAVPVSLGQWTHLVGVYDANAKTATLYVNGASPVTASAPSAWGARGPLELGRMRWRGIFTDNWSGSLDEVKVWDRTLSAAEAGEVAADHALTTGRPAKAVWHLDGTTATAGTGTSESDNLTVAGGAGVGAAGIHGKAVHFDGVDDNALGTRPLIDGTRDFSVAAWVRVAKPSAGDTIAKVAVVQNGQHVSEFALYYSAYAKRWMFSRYREDTSVDTLVRASQADCAPGSTVNNAPCFAETTDQWMHLVGVSDSTAKKIRLYINGYPVGETDYTQISPWASPGPIQLGAITREGQNSEFFNGDIDDVQVYDRIVTAAEARKMVQQRPVVAGRWKLNTATGSVTPDEGPLHSGAQLGGAASILPGGGLLPTTGTLKLDGTADYAAAPTTPLHTGQSFTVSSWASTAGTPTRDMTVLSLPGANNSSVTLRWHSLSPSTGEWQAEVQTSDAAGSISTKVAHTPGVAMENWTHLAVTYDAFSDRLVLYVNGQPENAVCADGQASCTPHVSSTGAPQPFEAAGGLQLGRNRSAGAWTEYFSGELDDVWLFQGVLGTEQIGDLANYNTEVQTSFLT
ncbi:LamG-like jellyroll fold domain-containing protein [Kitasatospora sp. NPDC048365]|uniref:LamG-like jellyroll fold domain-containing protein n=1 Tax=Kitasatospora sp. NPDC048365 TaxID=3364050 RepID=UPI003711DEEF